MIAATTREAYSLDVEQAALDFRERVEDRKSIFCMKFEGLLCSQGEQVLLKLAVGISSRLLGCKGEFVGREKLHNTPY